MSRIARCSCGTERPSSERASLPFFTDRSAGTRDETCKNCRYHEVAHTRTDVRPNRFICGAFEPMTEGYETDTFYCGCRGWD